MELSLDDLGLRCGTDKSSRDHNYLQFYEVLFKDFRTNAFALLEIGVQTGASVRMWHEYFPAAQIVGLDLKTTHDCQDLSRFDFVRGDQADPLILRKLLAEYDFKVVIDDGSHMWGHQIFTFESLFPWLQEGSFYICEDVQTSFGPDYAERFSGKAKESAADYFLSLARAVTAKYRRYEEITRTEDPLRHFIVNKIRSITFIRQAVIVRC